MHHDPAKKVLFVNRSVPQIAAGLGKNAEDIQRTIRTGAKKLLAARTRRENPFIQKNLHHTLNGLLIIGDEILSGKRQDRHFARMREILAERGLMLDQVTYLGDDRARLTAFLRDWLYGTTPPMPGHEDWTADPVTPAPLRGARPGGLRVGPVHRPGRGGAEFRRGVRRPVGGTRPTTRLPVQFEDRAVTTRPHARAPDPAQRPAVPRVVRVRSGPVRHSADRGRQDRPGRLV